MKPISELTDTLNKIEIWLQKNIPEKAAKFKPGLSRQNIEDKVKNLPFQVPESIYELYQWHNGSVERFVFNNYNFLSLENSLAAYEEELGELRYYQLEQGYFFEQSLPIFENWAENGVLLNVNCQKNNFYPIQMLDISCNDFSVRYNNLTDFMLHLLAWYESAEYYEKYDCWEVKAEIEWELEAKYMTQEYILEFINDSSTYPTQKTIYKNTLKHSKCFLDD